MDCFCKSILVPVSVIEVRPAKPIGCPFTKASVIGTSHNPLVATLGTKVSLPENFPESMTPKLISPSLSLSEARWRLTPINFRVIRLFDFSMSARELENVPIES